MMCKQILLDINLYKTLYEIVVFPEQVSTSMSDGERRFGVVKLEDRHVWSENVM